MAREKPKVVKFHDGRDEWLVWPTLLSVRKFEERSGIGLFAAVFDAVREDEAEEKKRPPLKVSPDVGEVLNEETVELAKSIVRSRRMEARVLGMARRIFGNLGHLGLFVYESMRPVKKGQAVPKQDEFLRRIDSARIADCMKAAVMALVEFFPDATEKEKEKGREAGAADRPLPGPTSTS